MQLSVFYKESRFIKRIFALFVAAGLVLPIFSIHASPDQFQKKASQKTIALKGSSSSCVGTHSITQCISAGACVTSDCPSGEYCIPPQAVAPAKPTTIKKAQCVKPDAVGEAVCADSGSQKIELVVKGVTVPVLEKCPQNKPLCLLGKCVKQGDTVCSDSDNTNYAKLLKWSHEGKEKDLSSDISVLKSGKVTISTTADPAGAKPYPDKCKGDKFLIEQACDGGVAKEVGINCGEAKGCLNPGADGLCDGFTWSVPDGICKVDKIENSNDLAARCSFKDTDNDGIPDKDDNCIDVVNQDQKDSDGDKVGDVCDNCPLNSNQDQFDLDQDKFGNVCDNCINVSNPGQIDSNGDGIGDGCNMSILSLGDFHSIVVKDDGTAWCWGANGYGMGDGTNTKKLTPVKVSDLTDVVDISSQGEVSCSLKKDGTVWCWGWGDWGQIGDGTYENKFAPAQVLNLSDIKDVSAHTYAACAVKGNGEVWCWGANWSDQLGNETIEKKSSLPVKVNDLTNVTKVFVGELHSCAVKKNGTVWCWGSNSAGELGDGTYGEDKSAPVQAQGLNDVIEIALGWQHTCALNKGGTVLCWGSNYKGQLGNGAGEYESIPTKVKNLNGVIAISANANRTCVLKNNGTVWCWGENNDNEYTYYISGSIVPVQVKELENITAIAVGSYHTCVIKKDASIWCWGDNSGGELGNGTTESSPVPVEVKF